uniref:Uncharacterized protein n=1 Tax=Octopus bimaculoides TaxID=37653 RepID=A0A0L8FVB1_OCTBM
MMSSCKNRFNSIQIFIKKITILFVCCFCLLSLVNSIFTLNHLCKCGSFIKISVFFYICFSH